MSEMFLSDVEQTRKILALERDNKELRAESKQLRTEFERTREIVDELVLKFLGHRHSRRDERDAALEAHFNLGPEKFTGLPVK